MIRFLALLAFVCAGPWLVVAAFEAAELQAGIDARMVEVRR